MPELPEVETARSLIADRALHRRIVDVNDSDSYVTRPHSGGELRSALAGRSLTAAYRRGKTIWVETSGTGDAAARGGPELGIHLGMSGYIVVTGPDGAVAEGGDPHRYSAQLPKAEWSRFTLRFADAGSLVLIDPRRLGRVRLNPDIGALGPDAAQATPAEFRALITKGTIAVKARLLDQSKIAGVGNLLADEALWKAKILPAARVNSLQRKDADRLYRALQSAVRSAIAQGGVHTGDVISARHPGGTCPRCGAEMRHGTVGGRSTWWCSREQRLRQLRKHFSGQRGARYGYLTQARTAGHQRSRGGNGDGRPAHEWPGRTRAAIQAPAAGKGRRGTAPHPAGAGPDPGRRVPGREGFDAVSVGAGAWPQGSLLRGPGRDLRCPAHRPVRPAGHGRAGPGRRSRPPRHGRPAGCRPQPPGLLSGARSGRRRHVPAGRLI